MGAGGEVDEGQRRDATFAVVDQDRCPCGLRGHVEAGSRPLLLCGAQGGRGEQGGEEACCEMACHGGSLK